MINIFHLIKTEKKLNYFKNEAKYNKIQII